MNASEGWTRGIAKEQAVVIGASEEFGVAYGEDGSYGCYESQCYGVNFDASVEVAATLGAYQSVDQVAGEFLKFEEFQIPGSFVNVAVGEVFPRSPGQILPTGQKIGDTVAFAIGAGVSPSAYAAGI